MSRRKPPDRIDLPRTSENEKRDLSPALPSDAERAALAARAWFKGYGKHKRHPDMWELAPYRGRSPDRTFCEDTGFWLADQVRIPGLLRRGIRAGLFGDRENKGDPTMLWTIDDNGWIYELRLTTPTQAEYHGFPMRRLNPFSQKVLDRYEEWLDAQPTAVHTAEPALRAALQAAIRLYS